MVALDGTDAAARLAAVDTLGDRLSMDVRNRLATLTRGGPPTGTPAEADPQSARGRGEVPPAHRRHPQLCIPASRTLFFGLSMGSVLVLAAIGLAITFGVMGVINMAHGELMMLGAYTTYVVQLLIPNAVDWSVPVAIPTAFVVAGCHRHPARTAGHPVPLRPPTRDAAGDLRRQSDPAADGPVDVLSQQPRRRLAHVDERHAAGQRGAGHHLQPDVHRGLHDGGVRHPFARAAPHPHRPADPRRCRRTVAWPAPWASGAPGSMRPRSGWARVLAGVPAWR
jgi:hypothetical protein